MNTSATLLSAVALAAAAGHVIARWTGRTSTALWLKPIPIILFAAIAALASPPVYCLAYNCMCLTRSWSAGRRSR
jgi:hypothetical protein